MGLGPVFFSPDRGGRRKGHIAARFRHGNNEINAEGHVFRPQAQVVPFKNPEDEKGQ